MATSVIPSVIDALVTAARAALPSVQVHDGYGVTDDPGDFLMVGVTDPDSGDDANSAVSQQSWANATGGARDENGDVTCVALSWNGDGSQKVARDAAFAIAAAVQLAVRPAGVPGSLSVPGVLWLSYGAETQLLQQQGDGGAVAKVIFSIAFRARV